MLDVSLDDKIWIFAILFSISLFVLHFFLLVLPSRLVFPLLFSKCFIQSKPLRNIWLIFEISIDMIFILLLQLPLFLGVMADYLPTVLTSLAMCCITACGIMHIFRIPYSKFLLHRKLLEEESKELLHSSAAPTPSTTTSSFYTEENEYSSKLLLLSSSTTSENSCSTWSRIFWQCTKSYYYRMYLGLKHKLIIVLLLCILLVFIISAANMFTCSMCIAVFPFQVSTYFSRNIIKTDWFCTWNEFCFIYFTVPKFMNESLIMNYHVHGDPFSYSFVLVNTAPFSTSLDPKYKTTWPSTAQVFNSTCFEVDVITEQTRFQCWTDLYPLQANTTYYTLPIYITTNEEYIYQVKRQKKVRTAPHGKLESISFASGGDVQWFQSTTGLPLASYAAKQEILFFQLGGDIHYENGKANCFPRVDWYLQQFEEILVTPSGYTIPLVTCIGNHEAGGFRTSRKNDAFYIRYYPHELGLQNIDPQERNLYHTHQFGNILALTALDSYIHTPISEQTNWLKHTLSNYTTEEIPWKMTTYHVGMYPSHAASDVQDIVDAMKKEWKPIMEQYGVRLSLEHHFHSFKMTYNLLNDTVVDDANPLGIVYVGDGMFGSTSSPFAHNQPEFVSFAKTSHVLVVKLSASQLRVEAITFEPKGEGSYKNVSSPLIKWA